MVEVQIAAYSIGAEWDEDINVLGKEIWNSFPPIKTLQEFFDCQEGCCFEVNVITCGGDFAGFVLMLHLYSGKWDASEYDVSYVCMTAVKPQFRNHGLGTKMLQDVENKSNRTIFVSANQFMCNPENNIRMRTFYEQNGYMRSPIGWTDNEQNEYDVFVKGNVDMDVWAAVSERVKRLWEDFE